MRILIAEDDFVSRSVLEKILGNFGYEVLAAENGLEAWKMFKENEIGMVITDWMMPGMDGLTLCKKIRDYGKDQYTYIIVLTAKDKKHDLIETYLGGADDHITKPLDPDELHPRIKTGERIYLLEQKHRELQNTLREALDQIQNKNVVLEDTLKQLKDSQNQVVQSEKMASIGQLAAGVAHEINNPTGFVNSNLQSLFDYHNDLSRIITEYRKLISSLGKRLNQEDPGSDLQKQVQHIRELEEEIDIEFVLADTPKLILESSEGTERIKKIVMDLKDFAHPGEDKLIETDINKSLESTLNVVWNELKYKAEVIKDYGDLPAVLCFPQQLNQVFMNLLVNAAQAIQDSGEIRIATQADDGQVEIQISDTGKGIPKENLSKVFDPFFTTKDVGKGTGLGLNVSYNIVKKHKGTINVQSEVGKGTMFTVRLPIAHQAMQESGIED